MTQLEVQTASDSLDTYCVMSLKDLVVVDGLVASVLEVEVEVSSVIWYLNSEPSELVSRSCSTAASLLS
jgi:hypothetical protein